MKKRSNYLEENFFHDHDKSCMDGYFLFLSDIWSTYWFHIWKELANGAQCLFHIENS